MKYIHKVEITGRTEEEKSAVGWNDPDGDDYEIVIFLDNFNFRKNQNILKVVWMVNYVFMLELICAMSRIEGLHDGDTEWCAELCPPLNAVEKMGFYYGFTEE